MTKCLVLFAALITLATFFTTKEAFPANTPITVKDQVKTLKNISNLQAPGAQVTQVGPTTAQIENGYDNLISDPGAEGVSGNGPFTVSSTGGAIASVNRGSTAYKGSKSYSLLCTAHPTTDGTCSFTISLDTANIAGVKSLFEFWAKDNRKGADFTVGWSQDGGSVLNTQSIVLNSSAWTPNRLSVEAMGATSTEVIFSVPVTGGDLPVVLILDELDVSPDKNEAIIANVSNATSTEDYTQTASWTTNVSFSNTKKWRIAERIYTSGLLTTTGTPGPSTTLLLDPPSGCVIDNLKSPANTRVGTAYLQDASTTANNTEAIIMVDPSDPTKLQVRPIGATSTTPTLPFTWTTSDVIRYKYDVPCVGWSVSNPNALSKTETWSFRYSPLYFSATQCGTGEIGCVNSYYYQTSSSSNSTLCTTSPTQAMSGIASDGLFLTARNYNVAQTSAACATPSRFIVVAPINMFMSKPSGYASPGKSAPVLTDRYVASSTVEIGPGILYYPETGLIFIEAGTSTLTTNTSRVFRNINQTEYTSAYFDISMSKTPSIAAFDLSGVADTQSVLFGSGSDCQSVCSTGTCNICSRVGNKITSVTFVSTGNYNVNGIDGTKYICSGNGIGTNFVSAYHRYNFSDTSKAYMIFGYQSAGQNVGSATLNCVGGQ